VPATSRYVAVVGPGAASAREEQTAEAVGRGLAQAGVIVLTGGLDGVMAALTEVPLDTPHERQALVRGCLAILDSGT